MEEPEISVLIFAHDRKEYLKKAIVSVLNQTLDRSKYEIIVIKNFEDDAIDQLIEKNSIKSILVENTTYGDDIVTGIRKSKGKIISFLEDDDYYSEDKLEVVLNKFTENKKLGYFHHAEYVMDSSGKVLSKQKVREDYTIDLNFRIDSVAQSDLRKLILARGNGNPSMMAVRKSVLDGILEYLQGNNSPEYFISYSAIDSGFDVNITSTKLTFYRVHNSNSLSLKIDQKSFQKWFNQSNQIMYEVFVQLRELVKSKTLLKMVDIDLSSFRTILYIFGNETGNKPNIVDKGRFVRARFIHNKFPNFLPAVLLAITWLVMPWAARKFYYGLHKRMIASIDS